MASLPIRWIEARAHCQATEEEDRVVHALAAAVPGGETSRERLEGQFGNPVLVLTRRIERAEEVRDTWERWRAAGLPKALPGPIEGRLDEGGVLHFRIDKDAAFGGELVPAAKGDIIDIQVKLKAYPANPEILRKVALALFQEAA